MTDEDDNNTFGGSSWAQGRMWTAVMVACSAAGM